jgi:hypothetical protein
MQTDLFITKEDQLAEWMRQKGFFSTHDCLEFARQNYYNRAPNTKSDFLKRGLIRKLSDDERVLRGFMSKDCWYEWMGMPNA